MAHQMRLDSFNDQSLFSF